MSAKTRPRAFMLILVILMLILLLTAGMAFVGKRALQYRGTTQAVSAAVAVQKTMEVADRIATPDGGEVVLGIKVSVAVGAAQAANPASKVNRKKREKRVFD